MWEAVQLEMKRRRANALEPGIQVLERATVGNPLLVGFLVPHHEFSDAGWVMDDKRKGFVKFWCSGYQGHILQIPYFRMIT